MSTHCRRIWSALTIVAIVLTVAACGAGRPQTPPAGAAQPDRFLFERGNEALKERQWANARTYFQQIVDGYPQSPFRPDAKLGMGDAFLGENSTESVVQAANEFREFLQFYPTNPRADYAQYKLGLAHFRQMRGPQRDQTVGYHPGVQSEGLGKWIRIAAGVGGSGREELRVEARLGLVEREERRRRR